MVSKVKIGVGAALAAAAWLAGPLAGAQGVDTSIVAVAKRWFLTRADARCHQLDPAQAMALKAGYVQSRNEAIRAGYTMAALAPYLDAARDAADRSDCASPQVAAETAAARGAYTLFASQPRLSLPAGPASWQADRTRAGDAQWRLVQYQDGAGAEAAMGLYGPLSDNRFVVMVRFADGARPYGARLLIRDAGLASQGLINPAAYAVSDAPPPGFASGALAFPARGMSDVDMTLSPAVTTNGLGFTPDGRYVGGQPGAGAALRFDFSTRAYPAIAALDPREDMVVEFDFSDGPRFIRFGVGDFITGLSFVALPSPYGGQSLAAG